MDHRMKRPVQMLCNKCIHTHYTIQCHDDNTFRSYIDHTLSIFSCSAGIDPDRENVHFQCLANHGYDIAIIALLHLDESMVRPHLEYASQVWDPYLQKDIKLLKGVQNFALRICSKNYDSSYEDLLDTSQLPKLSTRHYFSRLFMTPTIFLQMSLYPCPPHCAMQSYSYMYRQPFAYTKSSFYSFVPPSISDWNALPIYVTNATSASFKNAFTFISLTVMLALFVILFVTLKLEYFSLAMLIPCFFFFFLRKLPYKKFSLKEFCMTEISSGENKFGGGEGARH